MDGNFAEGMIHMDGNFAEGMIHMDGNLISNAMPDA